MSISKVTPRFHEFLTPEESQILEAKAVRIRELWKAAEDYSTLLCLNRAFLRSEITAGLTYFLLSEETKTLAEGLCRLHDYGFLTVESQPFESSGPQLCSPFFSSIYEVNKPTWNERCQKAFLYFWVPRSESATLLPALKRFCQKLIDHPRIVTTINDDCKLPQYTAIFPSVMCNTGTSDFKSYPVSKTRVAATKVDVGSAEWHLTYFMPSWSSCEPHAMCTYEVDYIPALKESRAI